MTTHTAVSNQCHDILQRAAADASWLRANAFGELSVYVLRDSLALCAQACNPNAEAMCDFDTSNIIVWVADETQPRREIQIPIEAVSRPESWPGLLDTVLALVSQEEMCTSRESEHQDVSLESETVCIESQETHVDLIAAS